MKPTIYISILTTFLLTVVLSNCSNQKKEMTPESNTKNCCKKETSTTISETSEITCPHCGHKKMETLPTDVCVIKYNCEKCGTLLIPKNGDCCVFCTYGSHKCPSKQE